jgi:hypothetical protein
MTATVFRLLALIALVLMPMGMASAPAAASAMPADHGMAAGHCEGQSSSDEAPAANMDCTAMCTAIPAREPVAQPPLFQRASPQSAEIAIAFAGIEPEIATPPPRV